MAISFFSPIVFVYSEENGLSLRERLLTKVDDYFSLGLQQSFCVSSSYEKGSCKIYQGRLSKIVPLSKSKSWLKIASYFTLIIPAIMLVAKFILRLPLLLNSNKLQVLSASFYDKKALKYEDHARGALARPLLPLRSLSCNPHELNEDFVLEQLKGLSHLIIQENEHEDVHYIKTSGKFLCFELKNIPGVVFKIYKGREEEQRTLSPERHKILENARAYLTRNRCQYGHTLRSVINADGKSPYPHLYSPELRLFELKSSQGEQNFIAEEKMHFYPCEVNDIVWKLRDRELRPAFVDLAKCLQKAFFTNISPKKIFPTCKDGIWSLVIVGIEHIDRGVSIFEDGETIQASLANAGVISLIKHLYSEESIDAVIETTPQEHRSALANVKRDRLQELQSMKLHEEFHLQNGIDLFGSVHLQLNDTEIENLGLDLDELISLQSSSSGIIKTISMKEAINLVLVVLNKLVKKNDEMLPLSSHSVEVKLSRSFSDYQKFFAEEKLKIHFEGLSSTIDVDSFWLRRIFTALATKGHISHWEVLSAQNEDAFENNLRVWM